MAQDDDAGEVAVGAHADPYRRRGQHQERGRAARELVTAQGPHRHHDRRRERRADGQAPDRRPGAAAQPDAVQTDERQQGARRMAGHVRRPDLRGADKDVVGEVPQEGRDVLHPVHRLQILQARRQPLGDAAAPAVNEGQRPGPRHRGAPHRGYQRLPRQAACGRRAVDHHQDGDAHCRRSAGTDVRHPPGEQGWPPQPQDAFRAVDGLVEGSPDHHRENEQRHRARHRPQITTVCPLTCTHSHRATVGHGPPRR